MSADSTDSKVAFSDREMQMLAWAMQSLKTPPDVDYDKLAAFAGMSNPKSASNAWAKIKGKLFANQAEGAAAAATPKRGRAKKVVDKEGDETPKTTPRKRTAKKDANDDNESPTKKRAVKPKPKAADAEPVIKTEQAKPAVDDADSDAPAEETAQVEGPAEV
ncbi:hypothetical protein DM02DRAFT_666122 [Periconia macrospinosa]|uniref:Uncharacterized protein n=1 Tax=Periconia macrospinosa TaxID=97972 RepID=A0A2V1EC09_9PLEO|nr:hypothetical protein DM02DRAFT_666122 [Periconia macrospinosa]